MIFKFIKCFILVLVVVFTSSCGKDSEEKIQDSISDANYYLSTRQCQPAIDALEGVGRQNTNAKYVKALAAAYACRANYSTIDFFGNDITKTASPSPLGGMTTYSTSVLSTTSPFINDTRYRDLQTAIDLLLYAGGIPLTTEPLSTERSSRFTTSQAADINAQLSFMLLVQVGKFMKIYGNADGRGVKGSGGAANTCFTDYSATPAAVQTLITTGGGTGACTVVASAHTELALGVTDRKKRLCEGVVLLNTLLDVLPGVLASAGGGDLDNISTVTQKIQQQKAALIAYDASFGTTATVLSQTNCENSTDITLVTLSSYYAVFFETLVL